MLENILLHIKNTTHKRVVVTCISACAQEKNNRNEEHLEEARLHIRFPKKA